MEKIRWGIIGCGNVTEKKSGPGLQKAKGSELVAVMRRDAEKARDYAERHGVPRWYADADELIADNDIDAVYIATPPATHREYTEKVAAAGKPVYVEKPMALDAAEGTVMVEACRGAGVSLFVAYYRRALSRFLKVKELIENGEIGDVRAVHVTILGPASPEDREETKPWRVVPEIAGGGYFFDLASHTLDFLDFALGPIAEARGFAHNAAGYYPAEDSVSAIFRFERGPLGSGLWCFDAHKRVDQNMITGTKGTIRFTTLTEEPVELEQGDSVKRYDLPNPEHVQQPLIQTVVDDLLGRGECPSTGESALRTTRIMDEIVKEYYS